MSKQLVIWLLLGILSLPTLAQTGRKNLSSFDNKRFHFGFIVSGNSSDFRFNLNQDTTFNTSLYGVANAPQGGFNLALLASLNMSRHLKLRFVPGLSFQDRGLMYSFGQSSGGVNEILRRTESVNLDVPLLLKIRTDRLTNFAAYALIGAKYSRDMQSQEDVNQQLQNDDILRIQSSNFSMDLGGGIDIFLPFFKLAFELKTEIGLINVLIQDDSNYANPLEGLKTRSYIFSICFEG
ncbi:MAG TPA: PorT family protein [Flavobacteriales bacterium]|jgi:hypothetical protein|nr:PorT family protein [Flavobacteriales bacterium]HIO16249.1 PorT family protein [Flavobacteriales bacterium]